MVSLQGKVAVVTGASSGIGEATALALAARGVRVALAARRIERLHEVEKRIETDCLSVAADVSKRDDVRRLFDETRRAFGRVDILVNNAGILMPSSMDQVRVDEWEQMIDVNLKGMLYALAEAIPVMKEQRSGHIVNIASRGAHRVKPGMAIYSATKFAVRALSEGLRQELSPATGIRVTVVSPGLVATDFNRHARIRGPGSDNKGAHVRPLRSEDVAEAVLYAVSQPPHVTVNEVMVMPTEQEN